MLYVRRLHVPACLFTIAAAVDATGVVGELELVESLPFVDCAMLTDAYYHQFNGYNFFLA